MKSGTEFLRATCYHLVPSALKSRHVWVALSYCLSSWKETGPLQCRAGQRNEGRTLSSGCFRSSTYLYGPLSIFTMRETFTRNPGIALLHNSHQKQEKNPEGPDS